MPSSLENAVMHAISFLTGPLINKHDARTIDALHAALMHNLSAFYAATWSEANPSHGSQQRVLSLSPAQLPPAPIWRSAREVGLLWTPWIASLGNFAFDLCVDPGCVAFRIGAWESTHIIWQETPSAFSMKRKTLAQSIIDDEENAIFDLIQHEVSSSSDPSYSSATVSSNSSATWMAPLLDQFPTVPAATISQAFNSSSSSLRGSPSVIASSISRSSSRASMISSSGFSFSSSETSDSCGSMSSFSSRSSLDLPSSKPTTATASQRSRRSRPRLPNVFIDGSKKEVTNYDGGKTTVLTGGVMLGNPSSKPTNTRSGRW